MKTNASSAESAWGNKLCIHPCEQSTKIAYPGSKLKKNKYELHKQVQQLFFYLMITKFILVLLSKSISKIRYSKSYLLYHITYTTKEALLYQPQRFILSFKSNRCRDSFGGKHRKYDMYIYFLHPF